VIWPTADESPHRRHLLMPELKVRSTDQVEAGIGGSV
jgi:hypothetical protein